MDCTPIFEDTNHNTLKFEVEAWQAKQKNV